MFRGGPYGAENDYARAAAKGHGPFPERGPDEGLLMGARNIEPVNGGGDWIVVKPEHWIFAGTGVKKGDRIPGLIGWEYHGDPADIPGLEIVAAGTAWVGGETPQKWTATIYPGPKGNFVFNASTIFWAQGLVVAARPHAPLVALVASARPRRARAADHPQPAPPRAPARRLISDRTDELWNR